MTVLGIIFLAIMIFPVYWMINSSLQSNSGAASTAWFPVHPSFAGYEVAIREQGGNLVTSLIISVSAVVLTILVATPAAYGLARFRMRGMTAFVFVLLIAQMIPTIVIANALYTLFNNAGLLNSYVGLILADSAVQIPFAIILIRAFMASIPPSLVEAALVDGADNFRAFMWIVIPISKNAIITAALFTFLGAWGDFLFALTLTSTTGGAPDHTRDLQLHRCQRLGVGAGDGHRRSGVDTGGRAAHPRPEIHRRRGSRRSDQVTRRPRRDSNDEGDTRDDNTLTTPSASSYGARTGTSRSSRTSPKSTPMECTTRSRPRSKITSATGPRYRRPCSTTRNTA